MNPLLFQCPKTERRVTTGIEIDMSALRYVQPVTVRLLCPYCNNMHEWKLTDAAIGDARKATAPELEAWSPCPH